MPNVTVPGDDILRLHIGISLINTKFSDAQLIRFACVLQQAGYSRMPLDLQ